MTALELCSYEKGNPYKEDDPKFKLKGGRVVWECISVTRSGNWCRISRLVTQGGKPFMMGLRYQCRNIKSDTEVIILKP